MFDEYSANLPKLGALHARLKALKGVWENPHIQSVLIPKILLNEGRRLTGPGVVMCASLAINDYCTGLPSALLTVLNAHMEELLEALTDDVRLLKEAKDFWQGVLKELKEYYNENLDLKTDNLGPANF